MAAPRMIAMLSRMLSSLASEASTIRTARVTLVRVRSSVLGVEAVSFDGSSSLGTPAMYGVAPASMKGLITVSFDIGVTSKRPVMRLSLSSRAS